MEYFVSVETAQRLIDSRPVNISCERVALRQSAGRVLAENIMADRDFPAYDRVMMDGIALSSRALKKTRVFRVVGTQRAGERAKTLRSPQDCFEVMTGAVLPRGCDCVVPVEKLVKNENGVEVVRTVRPQKGNDIHARGCDARKGRLLFQTGEIIAAHRTALLAACGKKHVLVKRTPRVRIISTGNEVKAVGAALRPFQVRASNREAVTALLKANGINQVSSRICPDQKSRLRCSVESALKNNDIVLICGGISKGKFDLVPDILDELGVPVIFRFVKQRPGKPFLFAFSKKGKAVFGLPGNPASTLVTLTRYVLPYLKSCQGLVGRGAERMILTKGEKSDGHFTYFRPACFQKSGFKESRGTTIPFTCSGDLVSWSKADGFIELPRGRKKFSKGQEVRFYRF